MPIASKKALARSRKYMPKRSRKVIRKPSRKITIKVTRTRTTQTTQLTKTPKETQIVQTKPINRNRFVLYETDHRADWLYIENKGRMQISDINFDQNIVFANGHNFKLTGDSDIGLFKSNIQSTFPDTGDSDDIPLFYDNLLALKNRNGRFIKD